MMTFINVFFVCYFLFAIVFAIYLPVLLLCSLHRGAEEEEYRRQKSASGSARYNVEQGVYR